MFSGQQVLNARAFRRAASQRRGQPLYSLRGGALASQQNAKQVFVDAEHFAAIANSPVYPTHLLYAALLTDDESRDAIMNELAINKNRLRQVAKRESIICPTTKRARPQNLAPFELATARPKMLIGEPQSFSLSPIRPSRRADSCQWL